MVSTLSVCATHAIVFAIVSLASLMLGKASELLVSLGVKVSGNLSGPSMAEPAEEMTECNEENDDNKGLEDSYVILCSLTKIFIPC